VVASFTKSLHFYVYYTQIENWYIPLICLTIYMWSCYWRNPVWSRLILFGISIGLAFNCRAQGAFYFGFLCLAPLFVPAQSFRRRFSHVVVLCLVVGMSLVPWSIRNHVYEKRSSPASDQSFYTTAAGSDPRVSFYGVRGDNSKREVIQEYLAKYPDKKERIKALRRDAFRNTFSNFGWLAKAVYWRSVSMYGLLPPGIRAPEGPTPTDWKAHWEGYVYWGFPTIFLIFYSLLGFASRPGRVEIFLLLAILSHLAVTILAATVSGRLSLPIMPLHIVLGTCLFFRPISAPDRDASFPRSRLVSGNRSMYAGIIILCVVMLLIAIHLRIGRISLYRPLMEKAIVYDKDCRIDPNVPLLNDHFMKIRKGEEQQDILRYGDRVRAICRVTNYMFPPKLGSLIPPLADFADDPDRETYFILKTVAGHPHFVLRDGARNRRATMMAASYFGATSNMEIRENDVVEIEGVFLSVKSSVKEQHWVYWIKAEKINVRDSKVFYPNNIQQ
jgi:hypothetical protein